MHDRQVQDDRGLDGRTVLQLLPTLEEGRVVRAAIALAEALAGSGARALIAAAKGPLVGELQAAGGEWLALEPALWNPAAAVANAAHLRGFVDREAIDLVHAHGGRADAGRSVLTAFAVARLARIPLVTSIHGIPATGLGGRLGRGPILRADIVTAPSRFLAESLKGEAPGRAAHIVPVSPGIDLRRFDPGRVTAAARAEFRVIAGLDGSERVIVHHARFRPAKGQMVLIDAVRLLVNGGLTGTVFLIVCDGPDQPDYRAHLDERIRVQGLDGIVRLVAASEAGPAALAAAHLAVLPSIEPEPIGRSAIEAMAMGLPLVASDDGALAEIVLAPPGLSQADQVGFRVAPGDAMALAEGIGQALALDPRSRVAMAGRAGERARRFSRSRMQDQIVAIYRRLTGTAR
jgi:glycosyltransferase involved in cell wall biosynthesis